MYIHTHGFAIKWIEYTTSTFTPFSFILFFSFFLLFIFYFCDVKIIKQKTKKIKRSENHVGGHPCTSFTPFRGRSGIFSWHTFTTRKRIKPLFLSFRATSNSFSYIHLSPQFKSEFEYVTKSHRSYHHGIKFKRRCSTKLKMQTLRAQKVN